MQPFILTVSLGLATAAPVATTASTWEVDTAHSEVGFKVRHLAVSNVRGNFTKFSGTVKLDEKNIANSSVVVTVDTRSVNTNNQKRDKHLRSSDFFDADRYPEMKFVSTRVRKSGDGLEVTGNLTLHGVTKPITLAVEGPTGEVKDPWGKTRRGATARATINRQDFGLRWSKTLETGGLVVGNDVKIELEVELIKKS